MVLIDSVISSLKNGVGLTLAIAILISVNADLGTLHQGFVRDASVMGADAPSLILSQRDVSGGFD